MNIQGFERYVKTGTILNFDNFDNANLNTADINKADINNACLKYIKEYGR